MEEEEDGVAQTLVVIEELKRSLSQDQISSTKCEEIVEEWQIELEHVVQRLDFLLRRTLDAPGDDVRRDMYYHCRRRALDVAMTVLKLVFSEPNVQDQAAVARMVELSLLLFSMSIPTTTTTTTTMAPSPQLEEDETFPTQIVDLYASYQRQVLRQRAKPAIAYLAQWRQQQQQQRPNSVMQSTRAHANDNDDDDDDDHTNIAQPHAHAIMVILGQGSALLHPLILWKTGLPNEANYLLQLCDKAIHVLDEQAQTLTKTVSDWFWVDRKIDTWMSHVAGSSNSSTSPDLAELDSLVEEMAFGCQLLARYVSLVQDEESSIDILPKELLPEWTWKYASLERYLGTQQWQSALDMACPVNIVMGMSIKVPSIVEDAQYLSSRALERATSTRALQAMGTVAHSISNDIWSTDSSGGVYQALLDQRGCYSITLTKDESESSSLKQKRGNNNTFASALLDALDDDDSDGVGSTKNQAATKKTPLQSTSKPSSAPASGGFLGSLNLVSGGGQERQQMVLDTQFCTLNGIHSASAACSALGKSLDALLEEDCHDEVSDTTTRTTSSMIELAREELMRYSQAYAQLLDRQVWNVIAEWCGDLKDPNSRKGMCLHTLRDFFQGELYTLNATSFSQAEANERLERDMLGPLKESKIIQQLDKCDAEVAFLLCKELSSLVATVCLEFVWHDKRFTDWGSLLLSKQVRMLQNYLSSIVVEQNGANSALLLEPWDRISQVVTILQLEKPSDWAAYQTTRVVLTSDEVRRSLSLRVDFSSDAIATICGSSSKQ